MVYPTGRYNLNFDISAFLLALTLLIMYFARKTKGGLRSRIYYAECILLMLASGNEVIVLIMRNDPSVFNRNIAYLTNMVSHFAHNSIVFVFLMYLVCCIGIEHYLSRKQRFIFALPVIIMAVFLLIPPLQRLVYVIEADGQYHHGPMYWYFYAETLFYFACCLYLLAAWRHTLGRNSTFFIVALIVGGVVMISGMGWQYLKIGNFILALLGLLAFYIVEENADTADPVSGLLNLQSFSKDSHVLFGNSFTGSVITVKIVNPDYYMLTYGIENDQKLQKEIGDWLKSQRVENLQAYSIGRGIFSMIYFGADQSEAEKMAQTVLDRFTEPWVLGNYQIHLNFEVWLASVPEHVKSHEQLLMSVTAPAAGDHSRNKVLIANEFEKQQRRIAVARAIAYAMQHHTFRVYYQPIYDVRTGTIHTAEALIRLRDPQMGFISPEEFIKIAEQNGTINEIGMFVFEEVCRFYTQNHLDEKGIDFIEVNLSTVQCMDAGLSENLQKVLEKYHLDVSHIDLEITESALIHDRVAMDETIGKLQKIGFTFSLDDFGTGFSNYEYVIRFPFSLIKIDKSILWAADECRENDLVLLHTIQMCRDLNRGIVVEGVETKAQRDKLAERGVEYLQGFYYSKPIDEKQFIEYIEKFDKQAGSI